MNNFKVAYNIGTDTQMIKMLRPVLSGRVEMEILKDKKQLPQNDPSPYIVVLIKCERVSSFKIESPLTQRHLMKQVTAIFELRTNAYKEFLEEEQKDIKRQREESNKEAKLNRKRNEKKSHLQAIRQFKLTKKEKADMIDNPSMSDEEIEKLDVNDLKRRAGE